MSIIGWIIIGALAGWIASMIMGRNDSQGWLGNIVVGIVGALVGGFVWGLIRGGDYMSSFSIGTLLVAILGSIIVLFIWGAIRGRA
ncbi:MAG: GlsB/YeaQ/YmgE family stress response membrane protein [Thermomicrobiales bacterium]|nr:GlsB/YeaQ/YmgE family stress response membrane protein [Thermomicrobiales bacterium]